MNSSVIDASILAPAAALALWSMLIMLWVFVTRIPALMASNIKFEGASGSRRYQDIEHQMPDKVNWKSHNYTHLMEQPTVFYAVIIVLALVGGASSLNIGLAWAYVGLRVLHSLWQSLVNTVPVRIVLFVLSSTCLIVLSVNAVRATL